MLCLLCYVLLKNLYALPARNGGNAQTLATVSVGAAVPASDVPRCVDRCHTHNHNQHTLLTINFQQIVQHFLSPCNLKLTTRVLLGW